MSREMAFLCLPNFSMIAFSAAVDVLVAANQVTDRTAYHWQVATSDERRVQSSGGVAVMADVLLDERLRSDALFICGGNFIQRYVSDELIQKVTALANRGVRLGGICTGTYVLARANLLGDERCTIHNDHASSLLEEFPGLILTRSYFELDARCPTSAGGLSPMLMMLAMVANDLGHDVAVEIASSHLNSAAFRHSHARQHVSMARVCTQSRLEHALDLMDANIEEPLSTEELADMLDVTKRQLQRLFKKYLNDSPMGYYARLRLERARELVLQTDLPIGEIAQKRGFSTPQHFCRIYRQAFGVAPMQDRRKLLSD